MIDLSRQVRSGAGHELAIAAGGTGRTDGLARGAITHVYNESETVTIEIGMLVKQTTKAAGGSAAVALTSAAADVVYGVAVEQIGPQGSGLVAALAFGIPIATTGDIAVGDNLGPSSTAGRARTVPPGTAGSVFGTAKAAGSGTGSVRGDMRGSALLSLTEGAVCTATALSPPTIEDTGAFANDVPTIDVPILVAGANRYLVGVASWFQGPPTNSRFYDRIDVTDASPETLTLIEELILAGHDLSLYALRDPDPSHPMNNSVWRLDGPDGRNSGAAIVVHGVPGSTNSDGIRARAFANATSAAPAVAISGILPGDLLVAVMAWHASIAGTGDLTGIAAGWTQHELTFDTGTTRPAIQLMTKVATDASDTATWTLGSSLQWTAVILALRQKQVSEGDGRVELVGTSIKRKRCDDTEHYHGDRDPGVNDDDYHGWRVGTLWYNETTGKVWWLLDNSEGAADWVQIAGPGVLEAHAATHQWGGSDAIKLDDLATPDDNTDLNASATRHGLLPKLPNDATRYLDGTGAFSVPAGGGGGSTAGLALIGEVTLGADAAHMEVTSIPGSHRALLIVARARSAAAGNDGIDLQVGNGSVDTGTNYAHMVRFEGASASNAATSVASRIRGPIIPGANAPANYFGIVRWMIYDYADSSHWRETECTGGQADTSVGYRSCHGVGHWRNAAAAIDLVRLIANGGSNLKAGSKMTVYGLRA